MQKIGNFVCKHKTLIIIITLLLLIPSLIGYVKTKINYDILVYLPSDIETLKGEEILTNDFNMGAFAMLTLKNMSDKEVLSLKENILKIDSVTNVLSINDLTGTTIPLEMLPKELVEKVVKEDSKLMLVTFSESTSDDKTLTAVESIRNIVDERVLVGGMSAMVLDTKELFNSEMLLYVVIAVIFCILVLELSLDSYIVPLLLISNIGIAILFNMGSNIFLGEISYITKAIAAVLQLGVTTDFSIFLYHKYERAKKEEKDKNKAMASAIRETLTSVFGSSLTTIAGFLALCTMNLTLGRDIGIVMAKGVLLGLICVITFFPALLLACDKIIEKTKHKELLPQFKGVQKFVLKHYKLIFIIFLILLIPAYLANSKTPVYYKLDSSIPDNYGYSMATKELKEKYNIVSQEMVLVSNNIEDYKINLMLDEIEELDGIDFIISPSNLSKYGISENIIPNQLKTMYETDDYKLILISSTYEIATDELNEQIKELNNIVSKYDENAIVAGEGPLMSDLVTITDEDFKNVNTTSILVIFVLMLLVLKSISLPVLLVTAIEFAIFINMGVPYFTSNAIPFIASVVIGTIQLGATIDYAILLTTKYLEERKNGKNKEEAIKVALDNSTNSIFVSGMCFFAATIGVGIVSKIDMIGSLCTLIARGAIISMIVVIMIVPSILIIFDKLIIKTTLGFRKGNDKMKKSILKKATIWSLIGALMLQATPVWALKKDETVYTKLNSNGEVNNVIVSEHLSGSDEDYVDMTNLENIKNVNGDETYKNEDEKIVWENKGNDIYYEGTTKEEMPIDVKATYYLDDEEMQVEEMLGKKGKVKIVLDYTNKLKQVVKINGQNETLYTPFVVATTSIIPNKENKNLTVNNGKVIDNGTNTIVVALATPGLYESLKIEELKSLNSITITYDTEYFELSSIYSVATNKLISKDDLKVFNNIDSLYSSISTLSSSSKLLVNGSQELLVGSKKLEQGSKELMHGINTAYEGSKTMSDTLNATIEGLKNKEAIDDNTLNYIASKVEQETSATIDTQIKAQIKALEDNGITSTLVTTCGSNPTIPQCQAYQEYINNYLMLTNPTYVAVLKDTAIKAAKNATLKTAKEVANTAKNSSTTSLNTLSAGLNELTNGLAILNAGAKELYDGTSSLNKGIETLTNGMEKLDSEGITKLNNLVNKDLKNLQTRLEKLVSISDNYQTLDNLDTNFEGSSKIIMVIDSIKKEKDSTKNEEVIVEEKSLWQKIKGLFE